MGKFTLCMSRRGGLGIITTFTDLLLRDNGWLPSCRSTRKDNEVGILSEHTSRWRYNAS